MGEIKLQRQKKIAAIADTVKMNDGKKEGQQTQIKAVRPQSTEVFQREANASKRTDSCCMG